MVAVGVAKGRVEQAKRLGGEVLGGGDEVQFNRLVARQGTQKIDQHGIPGVHQESMIPHLDHLTLGDRLDLGIVHHHSLVSGTGRLYGLAGQRDFDGIAVTVHMAALALMIGDAVTGIEFESAGDLHKGFCVWVRMVDYNIRYN